MTARTALLRERWELLRLLPHARRWPLAGLTAAVLTSALMPAALALGIGILVSRVPAAVDAGLGSPEGGTLLVALGWVAALLVGERILVPVNETVRHLVGREIDGHLRTRLLGTLERPPGIEHLEDSRLQDSLGLVKGGLFGTAGSASVAALGIVGRYAQTLAALAIVAWFSWWLAVVVFVVIFGIRRRWHRAFGALADALMASGSDLREVSYTVDLAVTPPAAKELRVFGLLDWLMARAGRLWSDAIVGPFAVRAGLRRSANVELAVLGGAYVLTFVVLARAAVRGEVSLGIVAAILQAEFSAAQLIAPTGEDFATAPGMAALRSIRHATESSQRPAQATGSRSAGAMPATEIVLDGVRFAYPGSDVPVLEGVELTIHAGESLALVGFNGAGKTTLVKLLCGLYEPTGGEIRIDGVPLADLDMCTWRSRIGVIFQDFAHYELPVRDNIAFGALHRSDDNALLEQAAAKAGAAQLIARLPAGWDTVLSRQYEGGADLSGGEWQRIALARALFSVEAGAGMLVLDEPTANLDVRAEAELFEQFLRWTEGVTSLLISHRFSTVRRADRIAVLEGGRITEVGSHSELLAAAGRYAEMFHLQATQFVDDHTGSAGHSESAHG